MLFFLPLSPGPTWAVWYFSSLAFLSSSVCIANPSSLVSPSFSSFAVLSSSLHGQPELFASDILPQSKVSLQLIFITSLQSLRVARRCFTWSSVSDDLFTSSCSFWFSFLLYLIRVFSSAFSPLLFGRSVCFKFLISKWSLLFFFGFFFDHAKAALAYRRNE